MLELKNVGKTFSSPEGQPVRAVDDVSLSVREKEFVVFLGPSGCGKSTLLRMIAGLEHADGAQIRFRGRPLCGPDRGRGMVFQSFALFPWLTVRQNIVFGPTMSGARPEAIDAIANHYLQITGLTKFAGHYPHSLSGGMQQRVAIARTLANEPGMILMDEPFAALDTQTRSQMQEFLATLWEQEQKTVVFVTHDIEEAIFLADRIIVFTRRPANIRSELVVPFARPRKHALKLTDAFFRLKREIALLLETPVDQRTL